MPAKRDSLIELKGAMLPILSVILRSLDLSRLQAEAERMFTADFFDGDLAAFDLGQLDVEAAEAPDWPALVKLFAGYGLRPVGIRGGNEELVASAAAAGLHPVPAIEASHRPPAARAAEPAAAIEVEVPAAKPAESAPPVEAPAPPPAQAATLIIDRPLRSGQRVYARGGDVVVLAAVNTGAEVIADGSIHVYAPLRGRALAGASGDAGARIFTTRMEAELVSVAGLYRTFDDGVPAEFAGKPAQIRLIEDPAGGSARLVVEALSIA